MAVLDQGAMLVETKDGAQYFVVGADGIPRPATSYEYFFGLALGERDVRFMFQVQFFGGRSQIGGFVLDFLVFTLPRYTPVFIQGEWAHKRTSRERDLIQQALLRDGNYAEALEFFGDNVGTAEAARSTVRRFF